MFIGHHAVAFAAKRVAPRTSLGVLLGAALLLDLIWPLLVLAGVERFRIEPGHTAFTPLAFDHYPCSHSLVSAVALALALGLAYWVLTRLSAGAWMVFACVVSHWLLDFISHGPDLPLAPGVARRVGLGLWNSVPATMTVEILLLGAGVWLYLRATPATARSRRIALGIFVAFLGLLYLGNAFGPPPPNPRVVAWVGLASWVFPCWAGWIDRPRRVLPPGRA